MQTGPPVMAVLCPDWIKWAGIPENVSSLLLHEWGEERHGIGKTLYTSDNCCNTELFNSNSNKYITLTAALMKVRCFLSFDQMTKYFFLH